MRWIVISALLVFVFLAGRWSAPRQRGVSRTSRTDIPLPGSRGPAPRRDDAAPPEETAPAMPEATSDTDKGTRPGVEPGAPVEGTGTLEIRGHRRREGFNDLELLGRDMRGRWTEVEWLIPSDYGPSRIDLEPGSYRLRARLETEPGDRLYEIEIRPHARFIVDLTERAGPDIYPLAEGLGRVDVRVVDVSGAPLSGVKVQLVARRGELAERTTPEGWVRFDVVPGAFTIRVCWLERRVAVREGRTQVVRIDGRAAAELEISGIMYAHTSLRPLDPSGSWTWWTIGGDRSLRYVLLKPGRYQIECNLNPNRTHVIDTITLGAGDRVRRAPHQVGVFVRFSFLADKRASGRVFKVHLRDAAGHTSSVKPGHVALLEPGEYTVTIDDKKWVSYPVSFRAGSGDMEVEVPVRLR